MDLDDDLGEDGLSRDGIDDFLEENYRRTAEREADHNFIKDNSNQDQSTFSNNALHYFYKHQGGDEVGFPKVQDYCIACKQCKDLCQNCNTIDLLEATTQAALQGGVILAVCALCTILYLIMLYLEKLYDKHFNPEKNKEKPW